MVDINHVAQKNDGHNWKCGQACLEMIFKYYNIDYNENEIWEVIKRPRPNQLGQFYTQTHVMVQYAIDCGLKATIYKMKADSALEALSTIDKMGIPAILLIREPKSGQGHYVVYKGIKNKMFYYCDPNANREFSYFRSSGDMIDHWCPQLGVAGFICVVFNKQADEELECIMCGQKVEIVHSSLKAFAEGIACPTCSGAAYLA